MGLTLLVGPANAGKVALLLERYLAALELEPTLIVPNRSDVERVERDLLRRSGALLGGSIGTFDDLFGRIARGSGDARPVATDAQTALVVRRVIANTSLNGLGASARFGGFADALGRALGELGAGLVPPETLDGTLAELLRAYRFELDRHGLWDRHGLRAAAAERVGSSFEGWDGRPVFAYGFEDLTGAQWALIEALSGRAEVTVSLPYEPGRPAFASLERTAADLAGLAAGRIEELPPGYGELAPPGLAHLERTLFSEGPRGRAPSDGAVRFLEGSGFRGTVELVAEELLHLLRSGTPAEEILVVCPSLEGWRAPLDTAFTTLGVPYAFEGRTAFAATGYGQALLSLLRFAWMGGGRSDLYSFLRSPFSGLARPHVDFLEGRLRGRAVESAERTLEQTLELRGQPIPIVAALDDGPSPLEAVRRLGAAMLRAAYGLERPPTGVSATVDLRAHDAVLDLLAELEDWRSLGETLSREEVCAALGRVSVWLGSSATGGRVAVVDPLRARTRRVEVVVMLGLEEGTVPRRQHDSPLLDDELRRELDRRLRGARLTQPGSVSRERYLFYTVCTRPSRRLYLVRQAATDDGGPRAASPFWDEARALFDDAERWTRRRSLSAVVPTLESAVTERERLRALAALSAEAPQEATAVARANGWSRRLERARTAFVRPTELTHPLLLEELSTRGSFAATELESFAECSSIWFLERVIDPKRIDGEVDLKLRGSVAHSALFKFFSGLPRQLGSERPESGRLEEALAFLRDCVGEALAGVRLELTPVERSELEHGLQRDLEAFVRREAAAPLEFVPRRFEVSFGSERSAPELRRGLELDGITVSGKIDRIDVDPFSARGIVQDYKSGKTAHSAAQIDSELKLQVPLYLLVLRDLIGIEPLGGVYQALAGGDRSARGLLRAEARDDGIPGFAARDYLSEDEFWAQIERAKERAVVFAGRIRLGDVRHDPKGGFPCPTWCDLGPLCRVRRA